MLDIVGTVTVAAVIGINLTVIANALPVRRATLIAFAAAAGGWIGLAAAMSSRGVFAGPTPFPVIGLFAVLPLAAVATLSATVSPFRTALMSVPLPLLIGLNTSRVFGALFLLLAADGRLSGPFPYSAGWGDIITGALALPLAWQVAQRAGPRTGAIALWNLFGAADLVVAVILGVTSAPDSPLRIFDVGTGAAAMQGLPWSMVPTVLVPFYLILHGVIFAKLRALPAERLVDPVRLAGRSA